MPCAVWMIALAGCAQPSGSKAGEDSAATSEADEGDTRVKARAGVGKRGQKLGDREGPVSTPAKALFQVEQQLIFANAKRCLQMYEISNDRYPRTHEEYMSGVIEANLIQLPELPEGQRYEYDPETRELMVITSTRDE